MRSLSLLVALLAASPLFAQAKKYALLVGVNKYEHAKLQALQFAVNDATELRDVLKENGYDTVLLTNDTLDKPTGETILKSVGAVLRKARAGDTVIFAFAGHGVQFEGDKDSYFCPIDARPFKDETKSLVSMGMVYAEMEKSFAGVKILLVDACRDDPDTGRGSRGIDADSAPRPPRGVAAFFSCSASQRAYEHPNLKHGIFFHHVLEGIRGKAKNSEDEVTFNSLVDYVGRSVERDVPKLIGGGAEQQPNQKADLKGRSPVLVAMTLDYQKWPGQKEFEEQFLYFWGIGRKKDQKMAATFAKRAAELGHPLGKFVYAEMLRSGGRVPKDEAMARRLEAEALPAIRKAAEQNHPRAQYWLAVAYGQGLGVEKDLKKDLEWLRKAADNNDPEAQIQMYLRCSNGEEKQAAEWLRKAADQNIPAAQTSLAQCYKLGIGLAKDEKKAVDWYRKAADQDDASAQYDLGKCYEDGIGMTKDEKQAIEWYRKAAAQEYAKALDALKRLMK